MSIEAYLQSIDASLQVIAAAMESGVSRYSGETEPAPAKAGKPKAGKSSGTTRKSAAKKSPPEEKDGGSDAGPTLADVRKSLTSLQKRVDAKAARTVLETVGGVTTLSKLDEDKYQDVIDEADSKE